MNIIETYENIIRRDITAGLLPFWNKKTPEEVRQCCVTMLQNSAGDSLRAFKANLKAAPRLSEALSQLGIKTRGQLRLALQNSLDKRV